jgi:hypothetical protein
MSELESKILDKLLELESTVARMTKGGPMPDLVGLFNALDELAAQLPADADPDLRHFLQRKSYQKAQLLLQGRSADNRRGTCGH